jgi:hypothetical protein
VARLTVVYATDEQVAARAGGDFFLLCPNYQRLAYGTDGVFAAGSPWTLTSASNNFATQGVHAGHVVRLKGGSVKGAFSSSGDYYAVDSATNNSMILREIDRDLNVGLGPGPSLGSSAIEFLILTLDSQIEDVCYEINEQYAVFSYLPLRGTDQIQDLRQLRQLTVERVLARQYRSMQRETQNDVWAEKAGVMEGHAKDTSSRLSLRWGPLGEDQPPTWRFGARASR